MPTPIPMVILGAGYLGLRIAREAFLAGFSPVFAFKRSPWHLEPQGLTLGSLDIFKDEGLDQLTSILAPLGRAILVYALSPDGGGESAYQKTYLHGLCSVIDILKKQSDPGRFSMILTSSTSVYAEGHGSWVDETSQNLATTGGSQWIVAGEKALMDAGTKAHIPWTILRYGGLYGPGRRSLLDRVIQSVEPIYKGPPLYSNRIHVDDGARLAVFAASHGSCLNQILNGVDTAAADRNQVIQFLWETFGTPTLALGETDRIELIRHRGNKRVSSAKVSRLGFKFRYPSYREGYLTLASQGLGS